MIRQSTRRESDSPKATSDSQPDDKTRHDSECGRRSRATTDATIITLKRDTQEPKGCRTISDSTTVAVFTA